MNTANERRDLPEYACLQRTIETFPEADDEVWRDLPKMRLRHTVDGSDVRLQTDVKAFWTKEALYFRFACEDDHVVATMTRRDDPIYEEDVVEVFLDETGKLTEYKEFELSPVNVQFDAIIVYDNGIQHIGTEWDAAGWTTRVYPGKARRDWACVWKIPFRVFKGGTPSVGDEWRMNCYRIDRGKDGNDELSAWSPTYIRRFHAPHRFGFLRFCTE